MNNKFHDATTALTSTADDLKYNYNKISLHCKMEMSGNNLIRMGFFCLYVIKNTLVSIRGQYD